jgi:zinc protease
MGVNPANVDKALSSALAQIKAMQEKPPGADEMSLWKDYVTGQSAVAMETNAGIAEALADAEFYGLGLDYPYRYADIIRAITPEQVQKAAKKYLHPNAYVAAIAGP